MSPGTFLWPLHYGRGGLASANIPHGTPSSDVSAGKKYCFDQFLLHRELALAWSLGISCENVLIYIDKTISCASPSPIRTFYDLSLENVVVRVVRRRLLSPDIVPQSQTSDLSPLIFIFNNSIWWKSINHGPRVQCVTVHFAMFDSLLTFSELWKFLVTVMLIWTSAATIWHNNFLKYWKSVPIRCQDREQRVPSSIKVR